MKHPIIVPKNHQITQMIVAHLHDKAMYQGKGFTLNEIRSNGFWIPGINRIVTSYIRSCIICRKHRGPVEEQKMAKKYIKTDLSQKQPFKLLKIHYIIAMRQSLLVN